MSHNQRFEKLLKLEKLNKSRFCKAINYTLKNLTNYVDGKTRYPNGELVIGAMKKFPHWNIRYWLLGEGKPLLGDSKIEVVLESEEAYLAKDPVVRELMEQLGYMRKEILSKEKEINRLKSKK